MTLNAKILGGKVSFFQSVCVLGYCIFPINLAAILIAALKFMLPFILKMIIAGVAFFWSSMGNYLILLLKKYKNKYFLFKIIFYFLIFFLIKY